METCLSGEDLHLLSSSAHRLDSYFMDGDLLKDSAPKFDVIAPRLDETEQPPPVTRRRRIQRLGEVDPIVGVNLRFMSVKENFCLLK